MPSKDIHTIDLNHLRTLIALYQESSMQAAAERLRITPPAVSYSLRRLREALDDPLFVRSNRGLSPTARVHAIMEELPDLVGSLDNLLSRSLFFNPKALNTSFHIAVPEVMGCWLIPRIYHRLSEESPDVFLNSTLWASNTLKRLEDEELNLGIHIIDQHPKSLVQRTLYDVTPVILCHKNHPLTRNPKPSLETISQHQFLVHELPNYSTYIAPFEKVFQDHGLTARVGARIGQLAAALKLIEETDMIMFTAKEYLPDLGKHLTHIEVPTALSELPIQVKAYFHSRQRQNPLYSWLLEIIHDEIRIHGLNS